MEGLRTRWLSARESNEAWTHLPLMAPAKAQPFRQGVSFVVTRFSGSGRGEAFEYQHDHTLQDRMNVVTPNLKLCPKEQADLSR
ncbi:MAG: hypothetical protein K6T86_20155 [Pirellulales bacterium]|nr:hypothetical protein [Pirellulales bacterium]